MDVIYICIVGAIYLRLAIEESNCVLPLLGWFTYRSQLEGEAMDKIFVVSGKDVFNISPRKHARDKSAPKCAHGENGDQKQLHKKCLALENAL